MIELWDAVTCETAAAWLASMACRRASMAARRPSSSVARFFSANAFSAKSVMMRAGVASVSDAYTGATPCLYLWNTGYS